MPVIGIPMKDNLILAVMDSLYSIVQMPSGNPCRPSLSVVQMVGILAAKILATSDDESLREVKEIQRGSEKIGVERKTRLTGSGLQRLYGKNNGAWD